jgi:hypothetical protein
MDRSYGKRTRHFFSMLLLLLEVTQLLIHFLRAPQAGVPVIQTTGNATASWVSAADIMSLALIVIMFGEFTVLAFSLSCCSVPCHDNFRRVRARWRRGMKPAGRAFRDNLTAEERSADECRTPQILARPTRQPKLARSRAWTRISLIARAPNRVGQNHVGWLTSMTNTPDIKQLRENWQDEVDSAAEYRTLAAAEPDPTIAKVYSILARMEETHISFWEERLRMAGALLADRRPSWRSRVLRCIARCFGPETVLSTIAAKEAAERNVYAGRAETRGIDRAATSQG